MSYRPCIIILLLSMAIACVHDGWGQVPTDSTRLGINELQHITHIIISGNKRTRRSIILREMSVRPGSYVAADSVSYLVHQNQLRIFNTTLFNEVLIDTIRTGTHTMIWHVQVNERWYIWPEFSFALADRNFNVWWVEQNRDLRRANIGLTVKDRNFRGNMEQAGFTAQVGYTEQFSFHYVRPYVDKKQRHGFGFSINSARNNEIYFHTDSNKLIFAKSPTEYIFRRFDATLFYTYRPGYATRHTFLLAYRSHHIHDTVVKLNPGYFSNGSRALRMAELHYRFDINGVDNWSYPLIGHKLVSGSVIRVGFSGMRFQAQTHTEAGVFRSPRPKWYASVIFRGQVSAPQRQPYVLRRGMGHGSDYVRGYEYYVMDGAHYGLARLNLKRELINITLRKLPIPYLPSIPMRVYPKIFVDAGYAHNRHPGNSFLNNRWLYAAGGGVDIVTAYDMKFRLEYAWNHLGQAGFFVHMRTE